MRTSLTLTSRNSRLALRAGLAIAALATLVACGDSGTAPPQPSSVSSITPAVASAAVGSTLDPISVVVRDAGGTPIEGVSVTFSVTAGGGSVSPATATTNASGEAATIWTLGTSPGVQTVEAAISGITSRATFSTVAVAGDPATIAMVAGNMQFAAALSAVDTAPAVLLLDAFSNPVPGVSVFFSVSAGGGTIVGSGATTNADGVAAVGSWTLGAATGENRLTALAVFNGVSGNPVEFTATAIAGSAARVVANSPTTTTAVVGTPVIPRPAVTVTDAAGNPVPGVEVVFTASTGATVTGGTQFTDSTGVATVESWVLGTVAQSYTLTATVDSIATPLVFMATAVPGAAATVSAFAGIGQSASVGRPVAVEPAVRVVDSFGNPLAGVEVVFAVTGGGGFALGRNAVTNTSGVATVGGWTLGEAPGINTLRATVSGAGITDNPITFQATATPGTPSSMVLQAGDAQTAVAGAAVAVAPAVAVRDNRGNPVAGVVVQFIVASGGGNVSGADAITNTAGVATVGAWQLGPAAGPQTLTARLGGVPDLTFTATAIAGAANQVEPVSAVNLGNVEVNSTVTTLPSVRVRDSLGNPVAGAEVRFVVTPVDTTGSVTGAVQLTNAAGVATLEAWVVGTLANTTTSVKAFVTGLDLGGAEPTFTATLVAAEAAAIVVAPGAQQVQAATAGDPVASVPSVRVTDAFGNSVPNQQVLFEVQAGNGTVVGSPATTNANGIATITSWTMPVGAGARTLTVSIDGSTIPVVVFTANVM